MIAAQFGISAAGAPAPRPGAVADAPVPPACSVRTAPQREPHFDDELPVRHLSLVHAAPELPFPQPHTPVATVRRRLTLAPLPAVTPSGNSSRRPRSTGSGRTERFGAPDPTRFGRQFAQGVVEALSGRRPLVQLTRHVSPAVQRGLGRGDAGQKLRSAIAPVLHSVHLSEPADGVCEMSVIVAVGPRYRAVAARLEWRLDHWLCTALQVG